MTVFCHELRTCTSEAPSCREPLGRAQQVILPIPFLAHVFTITAHQWASKQLNIVSFHRLNKHKIIKFIAAETVGLAETCVLVLWPGDVLVLCNYLEDSIPMMVWPPCGHHSHHSPTDRQDNEARMDIYTNRSSFLHRRGDRTQQITVTHLHKIEWWSG